MAAPIMGKKPTGERKPWVPTIVKWPIHLGRASWLLLFVGAGILVGLKVAAGDAIGPQIFDEAGLLGAAGLALLLALGAIVGGIIHPLSRGKAIGNAVVGAVLAAGVLGMFAFNVRSAQAELAAELAVNDRARQIAQDGFVASRLLPPDERGPRYARAVRAAEEVATGPQKEQLTIIATGMESLNEATAAERKASEALAAAGGVAIEGLTDKASIEARRKLAADAKAATQELVTVLTRVLKEWNGKLVPPIATDRERELMLQTWVLKPLEDSKRRVELEEAIDATLAALHGSFGRWGVKKGAILFKKKADEEAYRSALAKVTSLSASAATAAAALPTPTPAAGAPVRETIAPDDARQYAMSYVTLLQRGHFDEAYKYLPPDVASRVAGAQHETHWKSFGGAKLEELKVAANVEAGSGLVGFRVELPGKEGGETVVVLKQSGKVYAVPAAFLAE